MVMRLSLATTILGMLGLCGATLVGQKSVGSIRGVVEDKDFHVPLANGRVLVVETGRKVVTTDQGSYVFSKLPSGKYTLVFSKDGYLQVVKTNVIVSGGRLTDVNASLGGDITDMEEFVVQDTLQLGGLSEAGLLRLRFKSPSFMDSVSADFMNRSGTSDAASALSLVAGASVKDGKSAVIRGLPDRYVSSQMNGVRLPSADDDKRSVDLDLFPSAVIESIRVTKTFTPDQQGDASGGAVDVRLKGIPDQPFFFDFKMELGHNTQVAGRRDFLSYEGGGVGSWARDSGRREPQLDKLGKSWMGAVGTDRTNAPSDYKWSFSTGGSYEFSNGIRIGGLASLFYERDSSFYENGVDDSYWVEKPGARMTPKQFQGTAADGDFKTGLFDMTQGSQSLSRGGLATFGVATENHEVNFVYFSSMKAEDKATLAEDTRGKEYYFPGHDPKDTKSPGHDEPDSAPYLRLETLEYTERSTTTTQFNGRHTLDIEGLGPFRKPILDWSIARSKSQLSQPDKRQFGSSWTPGREIGPIKIPATHNPYKPSANFNLGNLQRIWKDISEESDQYSLDLELPFSQWSQEGGYLKFGVFSDEVHRKFQQDTYSNFNDNTSFNGAWDRKWSDAFRYEEHPIQESLFDVDYEGDIDIKAWYGMIDMPVSSSLHMIGGARFESTEIGVVNDPEDNATWYPKGASAPVSLKPGDGDVTLKERDILPSLALVWNPLDSLTLRASYSQTLARMTFKELTPILQQEYLGGPIFIGSPDLKMSSLRNYDLRLDYRPFHDGLFSVSWFRKDITDPIEYVQKIASFTYTTAENYPRGRLSGWELEGRQNLGQLWSPLEGLNVGANATLIDSIVYLSEEDRDEFNNPGIKAPMDSREMTGAPNFLYNMYLTYDLDLTGTRIGLFYTVQGDTLVSGAGQSKGNFVPNVYATEVGRLNLTVSQRLGSGFQLQFKAKNLTDPEIKTVYRSRYIGSDITRTSYTRGIDYSLSISARIRF